MNHSSSKSENSTPSADDNLFLCWGAVAGGVLSLGITFFLGHWLRNLVIAGLAGATVGALIDRSRR